MWRRLWEYYFQLILFTDLCLFCIVLTSIKVNAAICKCQPSIKQTWLTRKGLKTTWHCPGNTNWRGRLSTVDLFIEVACFVDKINNILIIKSSRSKLVRTRRSTVLGLPLQLGFPALSLSFGLPNSTHLSSPQVIENLIYCVDKMACWHSH